MTQCPAIRSGAVTKVTGGALRIAPTKSSGHNASTDHGGGKRRVLAAVAVTLKVRLDTPQGPQPLARAIVTMHLQQLRGVLALP